MERRKKAMYFRVKPKNEGFIKLKIKNHKAQKNLRIYALNLFVLIVFNVGLS